MTASTVAIKSVKDLNNISVWFAEGPSGKGKGIGYVTDSGETQNEQWKIEAHPNGKDDSYVLIHVVSGRTLQCCMEDNLILTN